MINKIISGGQTGADRAALDFAIENNIPYGGWLPKGRKTEDGQLPDRYHLQEMPTTDYSKRTEQNVIDSDGTVIISHGFLTGGSAMAQEFANRHQKPCLHLDMNSLTLMDAAVSLNSWIENNRIKVLNVAGPRARKDPDIYQTVMNLLKKTVYKNRTIDVVLFDFGGVLADEGWKKGFTAIAEANGLNSDDVIKIASDTVYETGYILGRGSESSFLNAMREKTGIKGGDDASLRHEIVSRFILRDWMIDLVKKLKSENLIVGILSDQTDMLDQLDARFDFFQWFDHAFNSYHMGKGKRDASLFDDIAGILKTPPDRILFIDDDPGNVERARQKGWKAILYTDRESFQLEMDKLLKI